MSEEGFVYHVREEWWPSLSVEDRREATRQLFALADDMPRDAAIEFLERALGMQWRVGHA